MTPVEVLRSFAASWGWEVREDGVACHLVEVSKTGSQQSQAHLETQRNGYPVRLSFEEHKIPDVLAMNEAEFRTKLAGLHMLESFRRRIPTLT